MILRYSIQEYIPEKHKTQTVALFAFRPDIFPINEMDQIKIGLNDIGDSTHCKFVCTEKGTVLGYLGALLCKETTNWFLDWFSVHPNAQGKGIGSALLSTVERWLQHREVKELRVQTCSCEGETTARNFYTKKHFELENTEIDGYAPSHSKLTYVKILCLNE